MTSRSLLFVPGARADRFNKAAGAGADAIIIDLEDAVLPEAKADARTATLNWLRSRDCGCAAGLRINSLRTADGCADVAALAGADCDPDFIMVPKAETAQDMEIVADVLPKVPLIAVVESARGLSNAYEIASASSGGVLFGGADFSANLGADLSDWEAMLHARSVVISACAAALVPSYDVPFLDVKDEQGLRTQTMRAKALGMDGRACIHPAQVSAVNEVFMPTEDELATARAILQAFEGANGGAVLHKGKLVDRPILIAAQRTLARIKA